ncbi:hypothetical protein T492DRAFT_534367 [Pavlovales sp. CCMP2436]|nr:hypothetical protein T492DRAFT_534367 [Pavlovales sp. CCMP2436]
MHVFTPSTFTPARSLAEIDFSFKKNSREHRPLKKVKVSNLFVALKVAWRTMAQGQARRGRGDAEKTPLQVVGKRARFTSPRSRASEVVVRTTSERAKLSARARRLCVGWRRGRTQTSTTGRSRTMVSRTTASSSTRSNECARSLWPSRSNERSARACPIPPSTSARGRELALNSSIPTPRGSDAREVDLTRSARTTW